ncbi:UNVERIFIED_CONTAM: hypothetical protein Slati_0486300 [Sesamum latifolium]|uniref:Reverse transcriptase domain-containing protein n=1 Tax=Sesamum latifolium TaxID=2727402 RepID=A0AAW2Y0J0_9LAMI
MSPDSAVGPGDFNVVFYHKCWEMIKIDVLDEVKDFLGGTLLLLSFMATSIALILKVKSISRWTDFQPISLCNTSNKILTKLLSERLKSLLPSLIYRNQTGFVPTRQNDDNVLLLQEIMHSIGDNKRD